MPKMLAAFACCGLAALHLGGCGDELEAPLIEQPDRTRIGVEAYRDKVYASWLGQIVGNIYGLSYEFQYLDEPGPDDFPYGYGRMLERLADVDGAFSDDDTDIEYMYLLQMEQHGIEPSYAHLAEAWKYHVRDKVWIANRAALTLMHAGFGPPITGDRNYNPHWFQIDPQLINEIWAVTAPGMLGYATHKSNWAARIMSDDFGVEPTVHYAAMYSAAFFEKDIERLIDIGTAALPEGSRFAKIVEHMKRLHRRYPDDWQRARAEMADSYYGLFDYNKLGWPPADAQLNGACAILALLYGQGDFQRTLDYASGMGFDADNQAATMGGLLGVVLGTEGIPEELLYPLGKDEWQLPFNDRYVNVTRHDLPDASIRDIAARTALQGEKVILANGGRIVTDNRIDYYEIDTGASFAAPLELPAAPPLLAERSRPFSFQYSYITPATDATYAIVKGSLPPGIELQGARLAGAPTKRGTFDFRIRVMAEDATRERDYRLRVYGADLARGAEAVIHGDDIADDGIEVIGNGDRRGATFYSRGSADAGHIDYYGYSWRKPQKISTIIYNPGMPQEFGGWFTSLRVEYRDEEGSWQPARELRIEPLPDFDNTQWLKGSYIDHVLTFTPVKTTAIRLIGSAGGIEPDAHTGETLRYYTSISRLAVYAN